MIRVHYACGHSMKLQELFRLVWNMAIGSTVYCFACKMPTTIVEVTEE